MSLFLKKAAAIGFANFIEKVAPLSRVHYNRSWSNNDEISDEHSKVLLSMSKNILKYDDLFTEAYKMQLLSLGQILNLSEIYDKISKVDISKISIVKDKSSTIRELFSEEEINTAKRGDLIIDSITSMTDEEIDIVYLLKLNKDVRWDLLAKRSIKNNLYYLENNYYFYNDKLNLITFIFRMWASNYKEDFISFINSDSIMFSFKIFKYTVREKLAFALGTVNTDMKIARRMRSEALGVSQQYIKGLHFAKNNFSKEQISSIISNFSDTKYYEVAAYIAEKFEIDETTSMLANPHCSDILKNKYAKKG